MFFRHMVWSFLWVIITGVLYLMPGRDMPTVSFWDVFSADKIAHVVVFACLTLFASVGMKRQTAFQVLRNRAFSIAVSFGLIYGTTLELLQGSLAQGRYTELGDIFANAIGCILGLVIFRFIYGRSTVA